MAQLVVYDPDIWDHYKRLETERIYPSTLLERIYPCLVHVEKLLGDQCYILGGLSRGYFIDSLTEIEEPDVWDTVKYVKTITGLAPHSFKLSDIDILSPETASYNIGVAGYTIDMMPKRKDFHFGIKLGDFMKKWYK